MLSVHECALVTCKVSQCSRRQSYSFPFRFPATEPNLGAWSLWEAWWESERLYWVPKAGTPSGTLVLESWEVGVPQEATHLQAQTQGQHRGPTAWLCWRCRLWGRRWLWGLRQRGKLRVQGAKSGCSLPTEPLGQCPPSTFPFLSYCSISILLFPFFPILFLFCISICIYIIYILLCISYTDHMLLIYIYIYNVR